MRVCVRAGVCRFVKMVNALITGVIYIFYFKQTRALEKSNI